MEIRAKVTNGAGGHEATVATAGATSVVPIGPKPSGHGSAVNGGELLFLALATCYCNDVYREAEKAGIAVTAVEVVVQGTFGGVGEPAEQITYDVSVVTPGSDRSSIERFLADVDQVAEIHNTLRVGTPVELRGIDVRRD